MRSSYDTLTPLHQDDQPNRSSANFLSDHTKVLFNSYALELSAQCTLQKTWD